MTHERISKTAAEVRVRVAACSERTVAGLRKVRRHISRQLRHESPAFVVEVVLRLVAASQVPAWIAYEILQHHRGALGSVTLAQVEQLGRGLSSWGRVDAFACYVSGPAWREGQIETRDIEAWSSSQDRWWRRAALVSTVALNNTARGGRGDAERTLAICTLLKRDRDDMVVKAMSWALRELSKKEPERVAAYVVENEGELARRVVREVRNKLRTGLKNPRSRSSAFGA